MVSKKKNEKISVYKKYFYALIASGVFVILFIGALLIYWYQTKSYPELIMADHINQLQEIFTTIDARCGISGFDHQRNYIDFLNVISFEGSQVGSMNLTHPKEWQGPYLKDNFTIQQKQYEIIATKKGYYIVPGQGVKLFNGNVIGQEIVFDENSDVDMMITDGQLLNYQGKPLAAAIHLKGIKIDALYLEDEDEVLIAMQQPLSVENQELPVL